MTPTMTLLAAETARPDPNKWVGPGLLGLLVILLLAIGTVLLWRNMNKQLKKVDFDEGEPDGGTHGSDHSNGTHGSDHPNGPNGTDKPAPTI